MPNTALERLLAGDPAGFDDETIAALGEEVRRTVDSTGWQIIMHQLRVDADKARDRFVHVEATDAKAVLSAQNAIKRFEWFERTALEIISAATNVEVQRELHEETHGED